MTGATCGATQRPEVQDFNGTSLHRAQDLLHLVSSSQVRVKPRLVTLTATRRGMPPFAGLSPALLMCRCLRPCHAATSQDVEGEPSGVLLRIPRRG